eukprot:2467071-Pyramimonas_sp.AAC.1
MILAGRSVVAITPLSHVCAPISVRLRRRIAHCTKRRVTTVSKSEKPRTPPPSVADAGKEFILGQLRAGARRPIEQANALQKVQTERPELVNVVFVVLTIIGVILVAKDLFSATQ